MSNRLKFALFTWDLYGGSIALQMQNEGHDVIVGQIQNQDDIMLPEQLRKTKPEKPKTKEKRLTQFDGMLKKMNAWKLLRFLQTQNPKDWYIFMDLNYCWKFGEALLNKGFNGNFPTKYDRTLEVMRERAKEFVKKNYPEIKVAEYKSFKKIQEGITFVKKAKVTYALKSLGDAGETIVPKSKDIKEANEQIISQLQTQKKDYEQVGFILEERIESPIELTPEVVFYNGEPVYHCLDIENKPLMDGSLGPNTGCAQNLIVRTNKEDMLNKIAFPPIISELAKQRKGFFIWDISLLFDKSGTPYFGEFCSGRPGWDSFPTEVAMSGSATQYFKKVIKKENPLNFKYGTAVRIFNIAAEEVHEGMKMSWNNGISQDVFLYDAKKKDKDIVTSGYGWDAAVITGTGNTLEESVTKNYEYVDGFNLVDKGYRTKDDFLSKGYRTSIPNRLEYAYKNKLINA